MQDKVSNFIKEYNLSCDAETRYIDLVTELGELGKEIIKSTNYGKKQFTTNEGISDEMGDCIFSLFALCHELNIDVEKTLDVALNKYKSRFENKGSISSNN